MSFSIRNLETLLWISRLGSFAKAAKRLGTTQPAISMRIRELERHLDVKLLERGTGSIRLTSKGRECVATAERIVALSTDLKQRISEKKALVGNVRVGVSEAVALSWLPTLVSRLNADYPGIVLEMDIGLAMPLWQQLDSGDIEVAIVPGPIARPDVHCTSLGQLDFKWMASPDLKIPGESLNPDTLKHLPAITLPRESNLYYLAESWSNDKSSRTRLINVCNSLTIAAHLAAGGVGITLLPPKIFRQELRSNKLRMLDSTTKIPATEFYAATKLDQTQPLAQIVVTLAAQVSSFDLSG